MKHLSLKSVLSVAGALLLLGSPAMAHNAGHYHAHDHSAQKVAAGKTPAAANTADAAKATAAHDCSAHGHAHAKKAAGPNGGRVLQSVEPHAEFFVTPERKVQVTFLDEDGKAVAAAGQSVVVTTGSRANPVRFTLVEADGVLVSDVALPAGDKLPVVVQIKPSADAAMVTERFTADLSKCSTCDYAEYACICESHG